MEIGKILVIGSTAADVLVHIPRMPVTGEDLNITAQNMSLGGCAYNVYQILRHFHVPAILFSPVGQGVYGDFVRRELKKNGAATPIPAPKEDNGCCYCLVDPFGERTFLSYHGAEYRFQRQWFSLMEKEKIHSVYLCGLELEEETGGVILDYLETLENAALYFAPGPRLSRIRPEKMARALALHPFLHLNRQEALAFTLARDVETAASALLTVTKNSVVITLGPEGAYCLGPEGGRLIPGVPARVVDTVGAGDSHLGAVMACRYQGKSVYQAVETANRVSAAVVEQAGAGLSRDQFQRIGI